MLLKNDVWQTCASIFSVTTIKSWHANVNKVRCRLRTHHVILGRSKCSQVSFLCSSWEFCTLCKKEILKYSSLSVNSLCYLRIWAAYVYPQHLKPKCEEGTMGAWVVMNGWGHSDSGVHPLLPLGPSPRTPNTVQGLIPMSQSNLSPRRGGTAYDSLHHGF